MAAACVLSVSSYATADQFKPSKADQVKLGKQAAAELRRKSKVLPSTDPRVRTLKAVGSRLLAAADVKGEPWQFSFDVIDDKQVNAFALPGGPTFFYTGLLDKLKTEDELAGVLGHEMTHVLREHWAYAYADSQKRNLLLNLGLILFKANRSLGNLAGISNQLIFDLPFSRKHESEADDGGFDLMVRSGYNPQGEADVFTLLRSLSKGGSPPAFLSDHPDDSSRIRHIQDKINASNRDFPAQTALSWNYGNSRYRTGQSPYYPPAGSGGR